jgi:hypothetical protein
MKTKSNFKKISACLCFSVVAVILVLTSASFAQTAKPLIKRTTYKNDKMDFGFGGTITIVGAPVGSITVEGWQKNEVEVSADIEVQAGNEADLAQILRFKPEMKPIWHSLRKLTGLSWTRISVTCGSPRSAPTTKII